jgi:flavin reductase (DIM6/NTAB) family NADH-FMN oxidoreductase RutF
MKNTVLREATADEAWLRKYPERTVLVVSIDETHRPNIITLGWNMPTSHTPPMALISVGVTRHSHKLIQARKEFVLVFPSTELEAAVRYCGTHSGRDVDKFKETGLTPVPAKHVQPPLIAEGVVNMECKVVGALRTGDHTVFAGEIVAAYLSQAPKNVLFNMGPDDHGRRRFRGF